LQFAIDKERFGQFGSVVKVEPDESNPRHLTTEAWEWVAALKLGA
jgi:hypothetical protein